MKTIIILSLVLFKFALCFSQNIYFSGSVDQGTVWDYDTVFLEGNVNIPEDVILEIAPGTKIIAEGYYRIEVYGGLNAIGTQNELIVFTVKDTTGFSDTTQYTSGAWDGIHFYNNADAGTESNLTYCKIEYCKALNSDNNKGGGIYIESYNNLCINACFIENNMASFKGGGVYLGNNSIASTSVIIFNSEINLNKAGQYGGGMAFDGNVKPHIYNNLIYGNYTYLWDIMPAPYTSTLLGVGSAVYISSNQYNETGDIPVFTNNVFYGNGQYTFYESSYRILIANNLFVNNMGSIYNGHTISKGLITNNTFYGNCPLRLYIISENYHMVNNIFWENHVIFWCTM
jgi:hypothetical protein